jgi:cytochrome c oxidase cbb3-type subunit 3
MWPRVTFSVLVLALQLFGQRGQKQFAETCGFCHGVNATGAEGPNLIRSALVRHDISGNLIGPVIREGRPEKGMPPIPLNQKQIDDIVAYLHSRVQESDRRSPARPRDYSLKLLLTGNAAAGKQFFAGHCGSCHSASGDLSRIASKYDPADLQARFLYPPDVAETATVTTNSGQRISGRIAFEDAFTIAIKDRDGWYRSWAKSEVKVQVSDPLAGHLELLHKYTQADMHDVFAYLETLK